MKIASIICMVVFLLCLLALLVLRYFEGRLDEPLAILPFFPAEIVPLGAGFLAGLTLVYTTAASLMAHRDRKWAVGALAMTIGAAGLFWFCAEPASVFLYGLRDRFVVQVGYRMMRQFAAELSQDKSLTDREGVLQSPGYHDAATPRAQKQWDDLVARHPFLGWNGEAGTVIARGGSVSLTWGSGLVGHWGFEVALEGTLSVPEEDRGRILKIADDIQFVSYYD